ncbi:hypothetical protein BS17DRAFT_779372 [Gyrodon lividus]|nr:hypothetical protein BS17DRAFT_779372 [Gyrodon lividus]
MEATLAFVEREVSLTWLFTTDENPSAVPLAIVRVCSPAVICLAAVSLFFSLPEQPIASEVCVIGPTVVIMLFRIAFTFLLEGLAHIVLAVVIGIWRPGTGFEISALLGVAGYLSLGMVGRQKEKNGEEVWTTKLVRCALLLAAVLDLTQVLLCVQGSEAGDMCRDNRTGACMVEALHMWIPLAAVRVMMLTPIIILLSLPHVARNPTEDQLGGERRELERLLGDENSWMTSG